MAKAKKSTAKKAAKKASVKKPVSKAAGKASGAAAPKQARSARRLSWLDAKTQTPQIEKYARQLRSFMAAMEDGVIEKAEVKEQEKRVAQLMRAVEPRLDDALHAQVTELLCELTAYDLMQVLSAMHAARPRTKFRG
jgi:hypothetical protein